MVSAWPNLKVENISKLRCSVNGTLLANIWIAGTVPFFELTKIWSRRQIIAWAKPTDRYALVAGRISFQRCLLVSSERAYSGAISVMAPIP